ncbi:hypothetical protein [Nonomuraea turcica]|uniref:hypothetical protein n=1 Tax=Nonomuraea sp. G32 TaxID=3067274 RepID=UPI00273CD6BC|nr:hypothetical protein [Nonomuraea sp. G32]MDP4506595.1 hypothetical protein [Nonomuraea sp. G32]
MLAELHLHPGRLLSDVVVRHDDGRGMGGAIFGSWSYAYGSRDDKQLVGRSGRRGGPFPFTKAPAMKGYGLSFH